MNPAEPVSEAVSKRADNRDTTNGTTSNGAARGIKLPLVSVGVLLLILTSCVYSPSALEQLLLGWIYFPFRVVPRMTFDWPTVGICLASSVLFVFGLRRTVQWIADQTAARTGALARRIRFRTTCALALMIVLLFASGIAMVGTTHQLTWLMTGRGGAPLAGKQSVGPSIIGLVEDARTAARRSTQRNNLKQIGMAFHNFHESSNTLPPGGSINDNGRLMHGWAIYLGNHANYSSYGIDFNIPWNEPPNDRLYRCAMRDFLNPAIPEVFDDSGYGLSHVAGNVHLLPIARVPTTTSPSSGWAAVLAIRDHDDAARRHAPLSLKDIHDGTSHTILIGEAAGHFRPWGHPANVRDPALGVGQSLDGFGGPPGAGGAQFLMADGSVRFISDKVDRQVIRALGTPAGGEAVDLKLVSQGSTP